MIDILEEETTRIAEQRRFERRAKIRAAILKEADPVAAAIFDELIEFSDAIRALAVSANKP